MSDLLEAFSDPLFDAYQLDLDRSPGPRARITRRSPEPCIALYTLTRRSARRAQSLPPASTGEQRGAERSLLPSEEVNDLIQTHMNYFPELEEGAEELWRRHASTAEELYPGLIRYLDKQYGVHVRIARGGAERGVLRRYDAEKKLLTLSELLPTRIANVPARPPDRAPDRARAHRPDRRRRPSHRATSRGARPRGPGELLRRRRAHAVHARSSRRAGRSATTSTSSAGAFASGSSNSATATPP